MGAVKQKAMAQNTVLLFRVIRYIWTGTVQAHIIEIKWHHIKAI